MGTMERLAAALMLSSAALLFTAPVQAEMTGKEALNACMKLMLPSPPGYNPPPSEVVTSGRCAGIVDAALEFGRSLPPPLRHCAPASDSTAALQAVTAWLRAHRQRLDEPFTMLAATALAEKWPCPAR